MPKSVQLMNRVGYGHSTMVISRPTRNNDVCECEPRFWNHFQSRVQWHIDVRLPMQLAHGVSVPEGTRARSMHCPMTRSPPFSVLAVVCNSFLDTFHAGRSGRSLLSNLLLQLRLVIFSIIPIHAHTRFISGRLITGVTHCQLGRESRRYRRSRRIGRSIA